MLKLYMSKKHAIPTILPPLPPTSPLESILIMNYLVEISILNYIRYRSLDQLRTSLLESDKEELNSNNKLKIFINKK